MFKTGCHFHRLIYYISMFTMITVVILAEDKTIQDKLAYYDLKVQTFEEVQPIQIYPARVLSHIFAHLGMEYLLYLDQFD